MAQRDLNFSPSVTNVVAEIPHLDAVTSLISNFGEQIAEASAQSKALRATADTQIAFTKLDNEFRQQYADDPTNPEGVKKLAQARQGIVSKMAQGVPTITMQDYSNKAIELTEQANVSNEVWTGKQQARNAVRNLGTAQKTYLQGANQAGRDFATNGGGDISDALNFVQASETMRQFSEPVIGKDATEAGLKDFNKNYVKSFVAGVAETSPQLAAGLLQNPKISQHFTTQDIGDMADLVNRTKRQQELLGQLQVVKSNDDLSDLINDPDMTYLEKRAEIDRLDAQGAVSSKAASAARRVIKSSDDLDTQTDTPVMAEIINQAYDLNGNTSLRSSEYLNGVKDLQDLILEKRAAGQLTGSDATKLSKQVSTLTQKRVSDSTSSVGYQLGAANKKFLSLPPQYRGQATRQLFYKSYGQNLTPQQLNMQADGVVDEINKQRRDEALSIISKTTNDDVFLQATGYTREDVAATAQKRGLSQEQVIRALRDKYKKKQTRPKPTTSLSPEESTETTPDKEPDEALGTDTEE